MPTRIGIVAAVRNCLEFTRAMVASIRTIHPRRLYIVDDHSDPPTKEWLAGLNGATVFMDLPDSTGVAANWNTGIDAAICDGATHVLVANNDTLLHPECIDRMVERIDRGDLALLSANDISAKCARPEDVFRHDERDTAEIDHLDFACFMITPDTLRTVGWFDENFAGAYYEDNDYQAL